jgi:hypothetical protein
MRGIPMQETEGGRRNVTRSRGAQTQLPPDVSYMQIQGAQALTGASEEQSDEDNVSESEEWGSGLGAWDNDPEVQDKVRWV